MNRTACPVVQAARAVRSVLRFTCKAGGRPVDIAVAFIAAACIPAAALWAMSMAARGDEARAQEQAIAAWVARPQPRELPGVFWH